MTVLRMRCKEGELGNTLLGSLMLALPAKANLDKVGLRDLVDSSHTCGHKDGRACPYQNHSRKQEAQELDMGQPFYID